MSGGVKEVSAEYKSARSVDDCPKGYMLTDIGMIPKDWLVSTIGDVSDVKTGPFGSALHEKDYVLDGTPIITVEHLGERGVTYQNLPLVSDADKKRLSSYELKIGDIVFSRVGSIDRNALISENENGWLFSGRLLRVRINNGSPVPKYLSYHFHSVPFKKRVIEVAVGQTMPSLNTYILKGIKVVLPPTKNEQTAIANALSDVDALIASLESLITKKRAIKTAAMQQLLTGKKRLPPFDKTHTGYKQTELGVIPEDWETGLLGDYLENCTSGATPYRGRPEFYKGSIRWISSGELNYNVIYDTVEKITEDAVKKTNLRTHPAGTFLMAITGLEAEGTRGACGIVGAPSTTNQSCMALYPSRKLTTDFLFHYYVYKGKELALKFCQGTKQQSYTAKIVRQLPIALPSSIEEQNIISSALSDMVKDIELLEQRLTKTQQLKQGMMQELLTGKTRLV